MKLEHQQLGRAAVVTLPARMMMTDAPSIRGAIRGLIDSGSRELVLDLSGVGQMDSSGLSVLISAWQSARKAGGDVVLAAPTLNVRSLIELTRMHEVLEVYEDRAAAVARLS